MNKFFVTMLGWFGYSSRAVADTQGMQMAVPDAPLVEGTRNIGIDGALQIAVVWACVELLANTIASLPLFAYESKAGQRTLARESSLWQLLHESPNRRMTPMEFWVAMILNLAFRGNAYARIERNTNGEAFSLWPMHADQIAVVVMDDGSIVYQYRIGNDVVVLAEESVLHLKGMGNGTVGLAKLNYMRAITSEAANAQTAANKLFANGGKPTGILMIDNVLNPDQREAIQRNFAEMASGSMSRLYVLEANMKYQQVNLSPQDMQLLDTRKYGIEEMCRWFGVPAVLINHSNVTAWGSGIEQLVEGFYKTTIRPALVGIEQALRKRVFTSAQRARYTAEFNLDGLLRASLKDRAEIYSKLVQNGIKTRNECRQLENDPPLPGGDKLTAQTNLAPLDMLGKISAPAAPPPDPVQAKITEAVLAMASRETPAPTINVAAPIVNVAPAPIEIKTGDTHVTLPEGCVQLEAKIDVPEIKLGDTHIDVPAPQVIVAQPKTVIETIERDADKEISRIVRKTEE